MSDYYRAKTCLTCARLIQMDCKSSDDKLPDELRSEYHTVEQWNANPSACRGQGAHYASGPVDLVVGADHWTFSGAYKKKCCVCAVLEGWASFLEKACFQCRDQNRTVHHAWTFLHGAPASELLNMLPMHLLEKIVTHCVPPWQLQRVIHVPARLGPSRPLVRLNRNEPTQQE